MAKRIVRKQIRGFVILWTAITALVAGVTFFGIYLTYGTNDQPVFAQNVAFPSVTPQEGTTSQEVAASVTLPPTLEVSAEADTTSDAASDAASDTASDTTSDTASDTASDTTSDTAPAPTDEPTATIEPTTESVAIAQAQPTEAEAQLPAPTGTPQPQPTAEPTTPAIENTNYQVGIQIQQAIDGSQDTQDLWYRDASQKLGLKWVKQQVPWEFIEPEQGEYNWAPIRRAVRSARQFDLNLMLSIVSVPEWARIEGFDYQGKEGPPADTQDFVNFVVEVVNRFGDDVDAIEVWNEQNLDREWMSPNGLQADEYVELLRRTYEAVKAINPNIIIISGALSPGGGWTEPDGRVSAIDDFTYMDGMIESGLLNYADCIGAHHNGYNISPSVTWDNVENDPTAEYRGPFDNPHHSWSFRSTLETYASKIQLAGGTQKLCVTEFGWPSVEDMDGWPRGFEFAKDNTLQEQAEWTIEALNNMEEWGFVWLAFIWNFNYGPQAGWNPENDNAPYSLIGPDFVHRPVYDAIIEWSSNRNAQ